MTCPIYTVCLTLLWGGSGKFTWGAVFLIFLYQKLFFSFPFFVTFNIFYLRIFPEKMSENGYIFAEIWLFCPVKFAVFWAFLGIFGHFREYDVFDTFRNFAQMEPQKAKTGKLWYYSYWIWGQRGLEYIYPKLNGIRGSNYGRDVLR